MIFSSYFFFLMARFNIAFIIPALLTFFSEIEINGLVNVSGSFVVDTSLKGILFEPSTKKLFSIFDVSLC